MRYQEPLCHACLMSKRISTLPALRVSERLEIELRRLADDDGRLLSDYVRRVLEAHVWGAANSGHERIVAEADDDGNDNRASQRNAG